MTVLRKTAMPFMYSFDKKFIIFTAMLCICNSFTPPIVSSILIGLGGHTSVHDPVMMDVAK